MTTRMGAVNLMRLWGDLSIWNRFGLAAIGAAIILAIVVSISFLSPGLSPGHF